MSLPKIASYDEWVAARKELLAKEKEATKQRDRLNAERRELPRELGRALDRSLARLHRGLHRVRIADAQCDFDRRADGLQQVVEVVRDAARELAQRFELLVLQQRVLSEEQTGKAIGRGPDGGNGSGPSSSLRSTSGPLIGRAPAATRA